MWFPRFICPVEAKLLACLSVHPFWSLTTHLPHTYVTSPWILQVNVPLSAGRGNQSAHRQRTSTITHFHTHRWGDSDGWHYCSCVATNGLLKWLIKGKQLLRGGTDGATPPTEAATRAAEGNMMGVWLSTMNLLLKWALIVMIKLECKSQNIIREKDGFLWLPITFMYL